MSAPEPFAFLCSWQFVRVEAGWRLRIRLERVALRIDAQGLRHSREQHRVLAQFARGEWLTPARVRMFATAAALSFSVWLISDYWVHTRFGLVDAHGEQLGRDFINYWAGARLAIRGEIDTIYRIKDFWAFQQSVTAPNAEFKLYVYPPIAPLLTLPFGLLPFIPSFILWTLSSWAVLARMLAWRLGTVTSAIAVAASPAFFLNLYSGQNGAFSAALLVGGILSLDRRPIQAGILFGLLCYKPQLALLVPFALIAGGHWRALLSSAATAAVLAGATVLLWGLEPWREFLGSAHIHMAILQQTDVGWARIPTVFRALRLLSVSIAWSYAVQLISALAAIAITILAWRSDASRELKGAILLIATFVATPYVWDYDEVVLLFAAIWYWDVASASGWRPWEKYVLASLLLASLICLAVPLMVSAVIPSLPHLQCGPILFWLALWFAMRRVSIAASTNKNGPALPERGA